MSFHNEENKLDWMYKSVTSLVDREEYLLGRKIDKTLEQLNAEEKQNELGITQPKNHVEHECIPPSIRDYNKIQVGEQQVDLATKLQEDPLVAIKKREEETRKQFLQNPIQLKKLQSTLHKQLKKKKKKSKKQRNLDIDALIVEKLQALQDHSVDLDLLTSSSHLANEKTLDKILIKKFRKYKGYLTEDDLHEIFDVDNKNDECPNKESDNDDDSNFSSRNKFRNVKRSKGQNVEDKKHIRPDHSNQRNQYGRNNKGSLTAEEKERRRKEMMENATWRDTERSNNVRKYKEEDAREFKISKEYKPGFIHSEMIKSANSGTSYVLNSLKNLCANLDV
ncbi:Pre-mRNA splicing factor [Popillia japonica]|uniref:Pre-mRNA splicing factor n=1 Tax=Popillia japonica TaxID=7064 RepID=A0AAW1IAZ8_POPJA